jgi:putative ABC transport system permease protein
VVMTFALGIGANAAIFSVVYGVLFRPLPYNDAESVILIQSRDRMTGRVSPTGFSGPVLRDWTERGGFFESVALCARTVFALETSIGFETVSGAWVSSKFFSIMGAPMIAGRPLADPRAAEIVISARLWRRSFGDNRAVIGRQVRLNSQPYTIVGVVGNDFEGAARDSAQSWGPG